MSVWGICTEEDILKDYRLLGKDEEIGVAGRVGGRVG